MITSISKWRYQIGGSIHAQNLERGQDWWCKVGLYRHIIVLWENTVIKSYMPWHHEEEGGEWEGKGEKNHRKIDWVQLQETRKKINGRKEVHFCLLIFTLPKLCLLHYHRSLHFLPTLFSLSWVYYNLSLDVCFELILVINEGDTFSECTVSAWRS